MRTHILTAVWKRPEVARICFEGIKRLGLPATAVISEESAIELCEEYGIDWVLAPNKPLGFKWNAGMSRALKKQWDYVMILGSDDIVSDSLMSVYEPYLGKYYMVGVDSVYFYCKGQIKKFVYDINMSVGAGRMMHRDLVEQCRPLWGAVNRGLDGNSLFRIRSKGYDEKIVSLGDAVILDIKSETNLNGFDSFTGDYVDRSILSQFSERERYLIDRL